MNSSKCRQVSKLLYKQILGNTKFEAKRSDAQYCSNSCKQKGSILKKTLLENQVPKQKRKFSVAEYDLVVDDIGFMDDMDFIAFCYFRQALPESASSEEVITYINRISSETVSDIKRKKSFNDFIDSFCVDCEVIG